ncbi:hypothetical protein K450DRAFT_279233 [Umbelopsis ramanniana AG]|uniref:PH domain-containing protein n=1 Tax=Umbelopsis ramanniana AG TaxID=1314678 RepID=A0AAD5HE82_UMBRA|nr:uncharacterized protein K450DRAFT_279233 [Umbelopsis ramanniana AG]KAI8581130.1 hypothetical protein K450DRAFT_279233 [Umbelopsis ramanniana AG]
MEPSSISDSFHTARSSITGSSPESHSSHPSARSSSIASTIKADAQQERQADMSDNAPIPRSDDSAPQEQADESGSSSTPRPEHSETTPPANDSAPPQPIVTEVPDPAQLSDGGGAKSTSQLTSDTAQACTVPEIHEQEIILCSIVEGKHIVDGPKFRKVNRTRKDKQKYEWRELEAVLTNKGLSLYTMSIFLERRKILHNINLASITQLKLVNEQEYLIELTARTSEKGGIKLSFRLRNTKQTRHWYRQLYSLVPQNSKPIFPNVADVVIPDLNIECRVPVADVSTSTYGWLKQMIVTSMVQDETTKEMYENWHQQKELSLCWRYKDCLEWCVDESESIIGPRLIEGNNNLELRKTEHMPTTVTIGERQIVEPEAIDGILTRLTNRRGQMIKSQKFSQRRFYFATHQQYLINLSLNNKCSREEQIGSSLGMIDLCEVEVIKVWKPNTMYGSTAFQSNTSISSSSSSTPIMAASTQVEREHDPRLCWCCFASTPKAIKNLQKLDKQKRCFEMVLRNGLSIIYEAQSVDDRDVWVRRLQDLSLYWKTLNHRMIRDQISKYKAAIIRQDKSPKSKRNDQNAEMENDSMSQYDEEAAADNVIYTSFWNYCLPSRCRYIMCAGALFYKNSVRKPFKEDHFVLTRDGQLVMFNIVERSKLSGRMIQSVYHGRKYTHDLTGSYVYTDNDNDTVVRRPARMYSDGLVTPRDNQDDACLFSVWIPLTHKFYSHKKKKMIITQKHTLKGKPWTFMARTKEDKQIWITAINAVLDRPNL